MHDQSARARQALKTVRQGDRWRHGGESHRMWAESGSRENTLSTMRTWREVQSRKPTGCTTETGQRGPGPRVKPGRVSGAEGILALLLSGAPGAPWGCEEGAGEEVGASGSGTHPRPQALGSLSNTWQRSPRCPNWAGQPPRSESPRHSSVAHWVECCQLHPQTRRGGGQRPPWYARSVSEGAVGSPEADARWGCVST